MNTADISSGWDQGGKGIFPSWRAALTAKRKAAPSNSGYLSASEAAVRNKNLRGANNSFPLPSSGFGTLSDSPLHRHAYTGPVLYDTRPDPPLYPLLSSGTPSPVSSGSKQSASTGITIPDHDVNWFDAAEVYFTERKLSIRVAKIREFHAEALDAEVKLVTSLSKPLLSSRRGNVDVAADAKKEKEAIAEHVQAMRVLSMRKDRERMDMVEQERRKMIAGANPSSRIGKPPVNALVPKHNVKPKPKYPMVMEETAYGKDNDRSVNALREESNYNGPIITPPTPAPHAVGGTSYPAGHTFYAPPVASSSEPEHLMARGLSPSPSYHPAGGARQQHPFPSKTVGISAPYRGPAHPVVGDRTTADKHVRWTSSVIDRPGVEGYGPGREGSVEAARWQDNGRFRAEEFRRREHDATRDAEEVRRRSDEARKGQQLTLMEQEAERERNAAFKAQQAAAYKLEGLKLEDVLRRREDASSRMEEEAKRQEKKKRWGFEEEARRARY